MPQAVDAHVDAGRLALRNGDGAAAREAFGCALAERRSGEALEGLGHAAYLLLDLDESLEKWQQAYAVFRAAGRGAQASRVARNVGYLYGTYAGDWAVANGWIARAQHLLGGDDSSERGWVALTAGMFESDRVRKNTSYAEALEVAHASGDQELLFTALAYFGASLVHADRTEEGMMHLDEAMAAVAGGDVGDQILIEEIFCQLFSACERAHDIARAEQWLRVGDALARRRNLPGVTAYCRTHYGGLMTAAGRWPEAEEALTEGVRLWALGQRTLRNGALARLAELRVRQGRLPEAEQLLAGITDHHECARPLAALFLADGRYGEAREVLERAVAGKEPGTDAAPFHALLVDVHLAAGDLAEAGSSVTALEACVARGPGEYLSASLALAKGRLALATGQADAHTLLREALKGFLNAQYPLESACSRLELAMACAQTRPDVALAEARAAYDGFERLRAARHVDAAAALLRTLGVKVGSAQPDGGRLTRREAEVLALVGQGLSNPEIAARLFISRKTVEHHVGNVLAKLGLRGRSEAAAYSARGKQGAE